MVNNWLRGWHWLLGGECRLCGAAVAPGSAFCRGCTAELPWLGAACRRCAAPLAGADGQECGHCQQSPPAFTAATALFAYAPPVDRLIQDLKYHGRLDLARVLGDLLAERLRDAPRPELLLPVPLHPGRLRGRGYNQSLELARPLARRLGSALDLDGIARVRATAPQAELEKSARRANLRGAFAARRDYTGLSVTMVDDVMTSGHTADALARCLLKAGAREVDILVIARA
jgi:ComF family protein